MTAVRSCATKKYASKWVQPDHNPYLLALVVLRLVEWFPKHSINISVRTLTFRAGWRPGGRTTNMPAGGIG